MKKAVFVLLLLKFSIVVVFSQAIVKTHIMSNPAGATIYVDGSEIGRTPMEFRFRDGKNYKIKLSKNAHQTLSFDYRGGSGNINKRLVALPPPPPAKPSNDSHKMKSPSFEETRHSDKGHHKQDFHNPPPKGHHSIPEPPKHKPNHGNPHHNPPPHQKRRYTLSITTDIPRAAVTINRKFVGTTPLKIQLEKGMHDIFINLPGHRDYHEQIYIERDRDIFVRFK